MTPLFQRFRQLGDERGFQPLMLIFPVRLQVQAEFIEDYPQQKLQEIAERLDIPLLDLLPILRREYRLSRERLFHDQCHYTVYGDRVVGEAVLAFVREQGTIRHYPELPAVFRAEGRNPE